MSGEISYSFQLNLRNGDLIDLYSSGALLADQSTAAAMRNTTTVPAAKTLLDLGSLTTPGWAVFKNLDDTNFIEVGIDVGGTFYPFLKLEPGEECPAKLGITAIYAQADTSPVKLYYIIFEE